MKKIINWMLLSICVMILTGAGASAQDFGQLLEAVDKLEVSLKGMVESEADQRQAAISGLQSELQSLKEEMQKWQGQPTAEAPADLSDLKTELERLAKENKELYRQLAGLTGKIIEMKSEIGGYARSESKDIAVPGPVRVNIPVEAAEEAVGGLEICGFFDVVNSYTSSADDEADFAINQAEVDFENQLSDNILACAAIAWNGDDGVFELAVAALEIGVFEGEEQFVNSLGFTAGQFDVPFGIDYTVYASPDRKYVTGPQVVDLTHGGWNDFGVQFNMDTKGGNLVIFGVNGFESSTEVLDEIESLALGEDVYEEVDTSPAFAFGSRLGITPLSFLEIGGSFSTGWNADNDNEMMLVGTDLQFSMANFELKGEYIVHSLNKSIAEENNRGYYLQGTYGFLDRAFVLSRYGSFKPEGADWHGQYSFGAGYALIEGVELRFQTLIDKDSDNNTNMFQLVAGF
ncbi:MAG: hypothetical protein V3V99_14770 [candidate division Zixibacteria bacterium]